MWFNLWNMLSPDQYIPDWADLDKLQQKDLSASPASIEKISEDTNTAASFSKAGLLSLLGLVALKFISCGPGDTNKQPTHDAHDSGQNETAIIAQADGADWNNSETIDPPPDPELFEFLNGLGNREFDGSHLMVIFMNPPPEGVSSIYIFDGSGNMIRECAIEHNGSGYFIETDGLNVDGSVTLQLSENPNQPPSVEVHPR